MGRQIAFFLFCSLTSAYNFIKIFTLKKKHLKVKGYFLHSVLLSSEPSLSFGRPALVSGYLHYMCESWAGLNRQ